MRVLEVCLCALLLGVCAYTSITDIRSSRIRNRTLLGAAGIGLVLNAVYYGVFVRTFFLSYLLNLAVLAVVAVLFYVFHFWAAGDSKLLILVTFLLPARVFGWEAEGLSPAVAILILTFSAAFLYIIAESILLGVKKKDLLKLHSIRGSVIRFLKSYVLCGTYLTLLNQLITLLLPRLYQQYAELFMLGSFFIAVLVSELELLKRRRVFLPCIALAAALTIYMGLQRRITMNPALLAALLVVVLLRTLAEKYNYEQKKTCDIERGMVLSFASAAVVNVSKLFAQPLPATEDVRSRLTEEQADKIRAWGESRSGRKELTIVRKVPFAIFISVGTILFMVTRVGVL